MIKESRINGTRCSYLMKTSIVNNRCCQTCKKTVLNKDDFYWLIGDIVFSSSQQDIHRAYAVTSVTCSSRT